MNRPVFYGLIAGVITSLISLFIYLSDMKPSTFFLILQFIPITVIIACIFIAISWDKNHNPNFSFRSALRAGVITTLVNSLVFGATTLSIWALKDPASLREDMFEYIEVKKADVVVSKDTAVNERRFTFVVRTADSALDKQIYSIAIQNYIEALAIKKNDPYVEKKIDHMVEIQKKEFMNIGNTVENILSSIVFHIIIGGIISGISYFLIKQR